MNKTIAQAKAYVREFVPLAGNVSIAEVVLAPPFTAITAVVEAVEGTKIGVVAQDLYFEREGAFTGEVSAAMIKDAGATRTIIGHSERRRLFAETDADVNRKLRAAISAGLGAIVCVGETLEERERGETPSVLDRQIRGALDGLSADELAALVVAYEPVWAIGTGRNATSVEAEEAHRHIRGRLRQWFGGAPADRCRILYGGSVKPENIQELIGLPDVDGALVGGASLEPRTFYEIIARSVGR